MDKERMNRIAKRVVSGEVFTATDGQPITAVLSKGLNDSLNAAHKRKGDLSMYVSLKLFNDIKSNFADLDPKERKNLKAFLESFSYDLKGLSRYVEKETGRLSL